MNCEFLHIERRGSPVENCLRDANGIALFPDRSFQEKTIATITYAGYGVWDKTRDATSVDKAAYAKGMRKFLANNDWVGDPAPGDRKYIYIVWDGGGYTQSGVVGENADRGVIVP